MALDNNDVWIFSGELEGTEHLRLFVDNEHVVIVDLNTGDAKEITTKESED